MVRRDTAALQFPGERYADVPSGFTGYRSAPISKGPGRRNVGDPALESVGDPPRPGALIVQELPGLPPKLLIELLDTNTTPTRVPRPRHTLLPGPGRQDAHALSCVSEREHREGIGSMSRIITCTPKGI